jgi:hypothetical protein
MLTASKKDCQDPTVNPTTGSASPNQMADENNCSAVSGHYGTSTSSHQECWRSEDLNRSASCSDDSNEVRRIKKSMSLGNILQKHHDHCYSEGTECDVTDHDFKRTTAIRETTKLCSTKNMDAFDASSDLISNDLCEASGDHAMDSHNHHMSYSQSKFQRSQSAFFQNNSTSDHEGSVDSEMLRSRCRSVDGLCSLFDEKAEYLSVSEMHHSKSNLDLYSGPSPDVHRALNMEDNGSLGCSEAADEGQRSSGNAEENFVRDGMLVGHEYWDAKYISGDHSVNRVALFSADGVLSDDMDQGIGEKLWNGDGTVHNRLLLVEVPDSRNTPNTKDIGEEPEHGKTDIDGDPNELTPRTYNIKRIEDWINQIDIDDITVDKQGENSFFASAKSSEPVAGVPGVWPDAKSPLGMEIAYTYISKLTPVSSSAQLANLGLVAIPRLSAFSGLRLLNLSGNSIGEPSLS